MGTQVRIEAPIYRHAIPQNKPRRNRAADTGINVSSESRNIMQSVASKYAILSATMRNPFARPTMAPIARARAMVLAVLELEHDHRKLYGMRQSTPCRPQTGRCPACRLARCSEFSILRSRVARQRVSAAESHAAWKPFAPVRQGNRAGNVAPWRLWRQKGASPTVLAGEKNPGDRLLWSAWAPVSAGEGRASRYEPADPEESTQQCNSRYYCPRNIAR